MQVDEYYRPFAPVRVPVRLMYIIAIAWLYVALMLAITARSAVGGVLSFLFYGLAPLALFLWLMGAPERRRRASRPPEQAGEAPGDPVATVTEEAPVTPGAEASTDHVPDARRDESAPRQRA